MSQCELKTAPSLYVVATPIGNLGDLTPRARAILSQVDRIAAEDTRNTARLLEHLGIKASLMAHHDHNQIESAQGILACLRAGQSVALVCDAGTPAISDPGCELVQVVAAAGFAVTPIPGVSSVLTIVSVSGLVKGPFTFQGFLPSKGEARQKKMQSALNQFEPQVFFESPHRVLDFFELLSSIAPQRLVCAGREMTKLYETFYRGHVNQVWQQVQADIFANKGEWAIVVDGHPHLEEKTNLTTNQLHSVDLEKLARLLLQTHSSKSVSEYLSDLTGLSKKQLYPFVLNLAV